MRNTSALCHEYAALARRVTPLCEAQRNVGDLLAPHVDAYNFFLESGLEAAIQSIPPCRFEVALPATAAGEEGDDAACVAARP